MCVSVKYEPCSPWDEPRVCARERESLGDFEILLEREILRHCGNICANF